MDWEMPHKDEGATDDQVLFRLIFKLMRKLHLIGGVRRVTELEDVLRYFSVNVPDDFDVKAGLLFRRRSGGSYLVAQLYLNDSGTLCCDGEGRPHGRLFRTLEFDGGLQDLFGEKDLIIFS
jgi:hypothetical protein